MSRRWRAEAFAASLVAAAIASAALIAAQPLDPPPDRRRAVGDWLVEHVAEEDGGRVVRMSREGEGFALSYRSAHWRGNHHPYRGGAIHWQGCARGGEESEAEALPAAAVHARLAEWLAECGAEPGAIEVLLWDFQRAFALAQEWNADAVAATEAEIQAIIDYPNASWANESAAIEPENGTACEAREMNEAGDCQPR